MSCPVALEGPYPGKTYEDLIPTSAWKLKQKKALFLPCRDGTETKNCQDSESL